MKRTLLAAALLTMPALSAVAAEPTTIIFVRHAERESPNGDNNLSDAGRARAQDLARTVGGLAITDLFVSEMKRTVQTAAPIAAALKLEMEAIPTTKLDDLVARLKGLESGSTALVVHHSGTIPKLVERLGGGTLPAIEEPEFDRMVVLVVHERGAKAMTLRYGAR